ncbi:MAG: hypothetical protein FGM53_01030 [Rhodocyclaceae bacterium]|jgi:hypothetical protein|nr:hypothetical protein [Rhodocyclaceae bacterium]
MSEPIAKKAAPFMMEAHRNAWLLVMESEQHSAQEVNALVDALFANAIRFSTTIDDNRVSAQSSKNAGEVTALRTLVDYVHEAEKQGHHESLDCFYNKITSAVQANTQFHDSMVSLLDHFSQTEGRLDNAEYLKDLAVIKRILGQG